MAIECGPMSATGDEIRLARQARGLSQAELAAQADVGQRTVGRLERGESEEPRKLGAVQKVLQIGPYAIKPGQRESHDNDPPLSQATFSELMQALAARYGDAVRSANSAQRGAGIRISTMSEEPPELAALSDDEIIGEWDSPDEGRSSG